MYKKHYTNLKIYFFHAGPLVYTYIITKLDKEHGGGIGLVGVNLNNGETDRQLALGAKEPKYLADEQAGRVFYFKGGDQIQAYQF